MAFSDTFFQDDGDEPVSQMPPEKRHRVLRAALAAGILFLWDKPSRRYYSTETEQVVREATIRRFVKEIGDAAKSRLRQLTEAKTRGEISQAAWEVAMKSEIKNLHRTMAVMARGGKDQMTQRDWGRVGRVIANQNKYLNQFSDDAALGQLSDAQQIARAEIYANSAYSTYENGVAVRNLESGVTRGRRVLEESAQHCDECPDLATEEFIPIDEITPIGDTPCQANCRCTIEYEDAPPAAVPDEQQQSDIAANEAA
jgi:hypothetical protein